MLCAYAPLYASENTVVARYVNTRTNEVDNYTAIESFRQDCDQSLKIEGIQGLALGTLMLRRREGGLVTFNEHGRDDLKKQLENENNKKTDTVSLALCKNQTSFVNLEMSAFLVKEILKSDFFPSEFARESCKSQYSLNSNNSDSSETHTTNSSFTLTPTGWKVLGFGCASILALICYFKFWKK